MLKFFHKKKPLHKNNAMVLILRLRNGKKTNHAVIYFLAKKIKPKNLQQQIPNLLATNKLLNI
jgi:hypothetical protein